MKIQKKKRLVAVFVLAIGFLGVSGSFYTHGNARRADGGAPPPPPIPIPTSQSVLVADGGAPPPPPIPIPTSQSVLVADGGAPLPPPIPWAA